MRESTDSQEPVTDTQESVRVDELSRVEKLTNSREYFGRLSRVNMNSRSNQAETALKKGTQNSLEKKSDNDLNPQVIDAISILRQQSRSPLSDKSPLSDIRQRSRS